MAEAGSVIVNVRLATQQAVADYASMAARFAKPIAVALGVDAGPMVRAITNGSKDAQKAISTITGTQASSSLTKLGSDGQKSLNGIGASAVSANAKVAAIGAGSLLAGGAILAALKPAIDAAQDLATEQDRANSIFGVGISSVEKYASTANEKLGLSKQAALALADTYGRIGQSAGLFGQNLATQSTELAQRTADIAQGTGKSLDEVQSKIEAGIRGRGQGLVSLGVLLNTQTQKEYAYSHGIADTGSTLTKAQTIQASYGVILAQTQQYQDRFANSSGSAAVKAKQMQAEMANLKTELGEGALPVFRGFQTVLGDVLGILGKLGPASQVLGGTLAVGAIAGVIGGTVALAAKGVAALTNFRKVAATPISAPPVVQTEAETATSGVVAGNEAVTASGQRMAETFMVQQDELDVLIPQLAALHTELLGVAEAEAQVAESGAFAGAAPEAAATIGSRAAAALPLPAPAVAATGERAFAVDSAGVATETGAVAAGASGAASEVENLGSTLAKAGEEGGGLLTTLGGAITSLPKFVQGAGLATIATIGFSSAWSQLKSQTAAGVAQYTQSAAAIQAGLDPSKPRAYNGELTQLAVTIGKTIPVGTFNAADSIKNFFHVFDDGDNRIKVSNADLKALGQVLSSLPVGEAKTILNDLVGRLEATGLSASKARGLLAPLFDEVNARAAQAKAAIEGDTTALDAFGHKIDETKGKLAQAADVETQAFSEIAAALSAKSSLDSAQTAVDTAKQNLQDIVTGNTDAVKTAKSALADADDQLTQALKDNTQKVQDALSSLEDAEDRLNEAKSKASFQQVSSSSLPSLGSGNDTEAISTADNLAEAQRGLTKAQQDYNTAASGQSDTVVNAKKRQSDAQTALTAALALTGPNSAAAKQATRDLASAEDSEVAAALGVVSTEAQLRDELKKHPQVLKEVNDALTTFKNEGLISGTVADDYRQHLFDLNAQALITAAGIGIVNAAMAAGAATTSPGGPTTPTAAVGSEATGADLKFLKQQISDPVAGDRGQVNGTWYEYNGNKWVNEGTKKPPVKYAEGGIDGAFPTAPTLQAPIGPNGAVKAVRAFEPQTGKWEAYIPQAPAVRPRAVGILGQVADEFGYRLAPKFQVGPKPTTVKAFASGGFLGDTPSTSSGATGSPAAASSGLDFSALTDALLKVHGELVAFNHKPRSIHVDTVEQHEADLGKTPEEWSRGLAGAGYGR